jgi:hypothetical protein
MFPSDCENLFDDVAAGFILPLKTQQGESPQNKTYLFRNEVLKLNDVL